MMVRQPTTGETRKAVTAAVVGNVLEWYDFAVYAFVATIIAKKFFPAQDEVTALLSTFLAYGLGFVARPLGGIVIGRLGDTRGRKTALLLTIFLMAAGTVLIGILPSYETIGVVAPLLLVVARLMQGFSAGGEWGGSTAYIVEWAPAGRRGWYGSFQQTSVVAGLLLGSGVAALMNTLLTPDQMEAWGWRVPFLLGGILGPVGLWMRREIDETPAYKRAAVADEDVRRKAAGERAKSNSGHSSERVNVRTLARGFFIAGLVGILLSFCWWGFFYAHSAKANLADVFGCLFVSKGVCLAAKSAAAGVPYEPAALWISLLVAVGGGIFLASVQTGDQDSIDPLLLATRAFGFTIVWTVCFYILLNYMPTWTRQYMKLSLQAALWANTIGLFVLLVAIPLMGHLSDRIGRKPLLLGCCVAYIIVPLPVFSYLASGSASYWMLILIQAFFGLLISMFSGPGPAAIAEIFATKNRSTWMTSGYALAVAIFGGFAPFIAVWLIREFGSPTAHAYYLIAAAVVSTMVIATLRETAHEELA
jgi:MFS family permease